MKTQTYAIQLAEEWTVCLRLQAVTSGLASDAPILDALLQLADDLDLHARVGVSIQIVDTELRVTVAPREEEAA